MPGRYCVLVGVEDPCESAIVREVLEQAHYRVLVVDDGMQALVAARIEKPDLVILGVALPSLNGFEVCGRLRGDPDLDNLPVIMLTSLNEPCHRIRAEQVGANWFVAAPFDRYELLTTVRTLLERRERQTQLAPFQETVRCLLTALEHRSPEVLRHSRRVASLAANVGRSLFLDEKQVQELMMGALLHDIGMLGLDGNLEDAADRWDHAVIGSQMLCRFRRPDLCAVVRSHHEHLNGTGGPDALTEEDLSLPVRIVAVCNRFDWLTQGASDPQTRSKGLEALQTEVNAGLWDAEIAESLREVVGQFVLLHEAATDSASEHLA